MFTKLLIANRGEIACRVIATARRMGVATVAVYSDADAGAKHVAMADEAVRIGKAPVAESYLLGERIIQAALDTKAQAIHPGYGFLSENPDFVEAVEKAGLTFVGPTANAIRAMGLKDAAKALMEKAGVPVVPGYHGADQDAALLAAEADKIGYPVLIKARAGGGGKGMRLVEDPADFAKALEGAQREGAASFGDPAVLVEKYIQQPRHIEIQVFGDAQGNVVHLFERDCSLQRRHQKVIEEAPAPGMTSEMRAAMGKAAVEAAKAIGYRGAGTVEFIVDGADGLRPDGFWFMEMNTRLQVEHPVSEAITGLDFVELQLRVAAGAPLPFAQEDLAIAGHAFEARIYAEDVPAGFLPAIGTLKHLQFPNGAEFGEGAVRIDSGVRGGDTISPWYDPMIAKLIVHGETRAEALMSLERAIAATQVAGTVTNLTFLRKLARHVGFARGEVDTGLIGRDLEDLAAQPVPCTRSRSLAALAASGLDQLNDPLAGFAHWAPAPQDVALIWQDEDVQVRITARGPGTFTTQVGEARHDIRRGAGGWWIDGAKSVAKARRDGDEVNVYWGNTYRFTLLDPLARGGDSGGSGDTILAPMPGVVKQVSARVGQMVRAGDPLIVLEAMKMEHTLQAPRDGEVADVAVAEGDQVTDGALLLALASEDT
ncbi:3-methylcrotonyl-CoA carboxylase [Actibacterium mucosum KCTC 23349]|uniref:3-methylcrotonyl-CoA carboxylase n=1 Tax=Actibacterium mucosum KCTC 23349 TaxID=1454373 RepID=A0A037ZMZ3_9RHOB|nr:acetyl/propionyl/methylcrotonyl-CoA carboxylase subunit alpha [Actibacterium mucosum]KAJ56216.1 3-methylcrotonyl-CoA carboxylase [Actibacterium mucosum KCTC 23349]